MQKERSKKNNSQLSSIDWTELLNRYGQLATSELAREKIRSISPLSSIAEAENSFREISQSSELLELGNRIIFESLDLTISWLPRVEKEATLKPIELRDVRSFLSEALTLKDQLTEVDNSFASTLLESLQDIEEPHSAIDHLLAPGGEIRSDASETLFKLNNEKKHLALQIENSLDKLVKENEMEPVLQDRFVTNREGRWVVPVKSGKQHDLPGIIHAMSHTKQTVFMEPEEVVPMNNRLKRVEIEIEEEIDRLLREISSYLHSLHAELKGTQRAVLQADVRLAQAQLSQMMGASPVEFHDENISLKKVKHPLLTLGQEKIISNDVNLDNKTPALLLSGPNAGGKTVLLKSIGLAAQMARCGLPVCASKESKLPFFADIYISVGDHQSVDEQLSTFAAHLRDLNHFLDASGPNNLILIDEMCGSTDPEEGGALARSFIESFAKNKAFTIVTSHLGALKTGWSEESGVVNGSLEYDMETGLPTYRFLFGISGQSQAIQTARRVGVSTKIVESAIQYMSLESRERLGLSEELDQKKSEIEKLKKQYRASIQAAEKAEREFQKKLEELNSKANEEVEKLVSKAKTEVDSLVDAAKVDQIFRSHEDSIALKKKIQKVVTKSDQANAPTSVDEFEKFFPKGAQVFIPSLKKSAIVQSAPNQKGEVSILSDSMRLQIKWHQLERPTGQVPTEKKTSRNLHKFVDVDDSSIDLRGKRVEEAIEYLEVELDAAMNRDADRIKVIHGHGTETLKKAVRSHLSRSTYVASWQAGSPPTGGDGVTWVTLTE